jgi:dipeptide transport system substrate-binding protein
VSKLTRALCLAALLAASSACHAAKTLVYCSEGSPEGFNPQFFLTGATADASSIPIYNRLVAFAPGTTSVVPSLAESWTGSADGLVYTFKLRQGVKFHSNAKFKPTRDFNADDVLFSYFRMADPNHPFHRVKHGQTYVNFDDMGMNRIVDKLEKLDPYTVRFTLKHPEAPFVANLAMDFASILSAEYADKMMAAGTPEVIDHEPIGTGPFQFVSYQKDTVIRYKAFDAYWDGRPKIDHLVFAITIEPSVRYAKLKAGECHVMALPKPGDVLLMKNDPDIKLLAKEGMNIGYIGFNIEKKPLGDKLVRQALNLAVDKRAIVRTVYQEFGQVAKNPIPPSMWSHNDRVGEYPYDPARARELLAKAGLAGGFELELWYLPMSRPYNPDGRRMAELVQADWEKIGVKTRLVTFEWSEYRRRAKAGEHQAMMFGWFSGNGDPDNLFVPQLGCDAVKGGGNVSRWCDPRFERLVQQAKTLPLESSRARLYEQAQQIVFEEAPRINIAHSVGFTPVRKEVLNYVMDATGHHDFSKVDLAR